MSLKERVYSVLVVSAAEKMNTALSSLLVEPLYRPVRIVSNVSAARRAWNERSYDFIIVNSPLPDDTGIRFAIDASAAKSPVILLLIRGEFYPETFVPCAILPELPHYYHRLRCSSVVSWQYVIVDGISQ